MREILFRGKNAKGEWEYGVPLITGLHSEIAYITQANSYTYRVEIDTVGQFTGLTDKNGKKIFEGDIVTHFINWLGKRVNGVVKYDNKVASWVCDFAPEKESAFLADWVDGNGCEIIGNIHDNPELLKGE